MEHISAKGSGDVVVCGRPGVVEFVDAERIIVRVDEKKVIFMSSGLIFIL